MKHLGSSPFWFGAALSIRFTTVEPTPVLIRSSRSAQRSAASPLTDHFCGYGACGLFLPGKYLLPVVLHADHGPALRLGLVVQRLGKRADLAVRQSLRRTIRVFARGVVVQHQHFQRSTAIRLGVLQHLPVTVRVAKRCSGMLPDEQINIFRLACTIV